MYTRERFSVQEGTRQAHTHCHGHDHKNTHSQTTTHHTTTQHDITPSLFACVSSQLALFSHVSVSFHHSLSSHMCLSFHLSLLILLSLLNSLTALALLSLPLSQGKKVQMQICRHCFFADLCLKKTKMSRKNYSFFLLTKLSLNYFTIYLCNHVSC